MRNYFIVKTIPNDIVFSNGMVIAITHGIFLDI
jgi:hypothetical protein